MASPKQIVVVEDDGAIAEIVSYNLREQGFNVQLAYDGQEGLELIRKTLPDLVVLDLMLPSLDGTEICRELRAESATRDMLVLMLTAKSEETDQVIGFAVGADDYVTKPFSVKVLVERVKALLRRKGTKEEDRDIVQHLGVSIDRHSHVAKAGDLVLDLTPSEFSLLDALMRQPGRAFTRHDLIDAALGGDAIVLERTIDVHIRSLRKKLDQFADVIETVRGVGYRLRNA